MATAEMVVQLVAPPTVGVSSPVRKTRAWVSNVKNASSVS